MNNHSFCVCVRSENKVRWLFPNWQIFLSNGSNFPLIAGNELRDADSLELLALVAFFQTHWSLPTHWKGKTFNEFSGSHLKGDLENRSWDLMLCFTTRLLYENVVKIQMDRKEVGTIYMYTTLLKRAIFLLRGTKWATQAGQVDAFFLLGQLTDTQDFLYFSCWRS